MLPRFQIESPSSLPQALAILAEDSQALPVCGGTDLLVQLRAGMCTCNRLISLRNLPELQVVEKREDNLFIGAACSMSQLENDPLVRRYAPLLAQGCATVGSPPIRNLATLGGNVENASPAGDALTALLGEHAFVLLQSAVGHREIPIEHYILGPRRTCRKPDELIVGFRISTRSASFRKFFKVGRRNALAISVVNGCISASAQNGVLQDVDIILGAVAPVPVRLPQISEMLNEKLYTEKLDRMVQEMMEDSIHPISDIRASKEYRTYISGVMVRRALRAAAGWEVQSL